MSADDEGFDAAAFGRQFVEFMRMMHRIAPAEPTALHGRLSEHVGQSIDGLPVVTDTYPAYQHANVQVAIDAYLALPDRTGELIGISGPGREHQSLSELLSGMGYGMYRLGAPDYVSVPIGVDSEHACISFGFYLIRTGTERLAVFVRKAIDRGPRNEGIELEVIAPDPATSHAFLRELRRLTVERNIFRGQVISLEPHEFGRGVGPLSFHRRPTVPIDDVILPTGVLSTVRRQVMGVAEHRDRLLAAGHHLKRGVLLFGPPGTGKTHTVRHLMGELPKATVLLLTGLGLGMVRDACALARAVEPALLVLEDVDLVAEDRGFGAGGQPQPLLYQLLNEMDGIAGDADVAFLLTTNRVDLIEAALAQRPGRVDLAVEVPLPGDADRRRLLALYGHNLDLTNDEIEELVAATAGATAALFAELARRAELLAATEGAASAGAAHARAALAELTASQAALASARGGARPH
jgi:ATP-dependent 26S proteasome regulatory subunit